MAEPAEEGQFELDVGDAEATEVELEQPEEKDVPRGTTDSEEPAVEVEQEAPPEDELAEYSESVQKRINRLTKKMREAERREEEAIKFAQNVQAESEQIKQRDAEPRPRFYDRIRSTHSTSTGAGGSGPQTCGRAR